MLSVQTDHTPLFLNRRYHLLEPLGAGGMAAVYRAYDRFTAETVALKRVLPPTDALPADPTNDNSAFLRLALTQEFQALASLRHPNIIGVRDYGFDPDRQPYFTMELLPAAQTIRQAGRDHSVEFQVNLILQMLHALAYLHRRAIVHRDLKPGNVLVVGETVKVLDFGLAAIAGQGGLIVGTPAYIAPEVLRGEAATPAADLFAVGVIAFDLLAGRHPFDSAADSVMLAILTEEPEWGDLDPAFVAVLRHLLAKQPNGRYGSAQEVIAAFSAVMGQPLPVETAAIRESFLQAAAFVGREAEKAALFAAQAAAQAGQGSAWLVGGESGVGKSRLLEEVRTQALVAGAQVLRGHGIREGGGAYHLWQETARWLALLADPDELKAGVLKGLVPDIAALLNRPVADAPSLEPQAAQTRLFLVVAELLWGCARRQPLVLLFEDCHWADVNSLELLAWVIRALAEHRLLLVADYRHDESPDLPHRLPAAHLLKLDRLTADNIAELSAAMLGGGGRQTAIVEFLQQETEGNAFFVVEAVRFLAEEAGQLDKVVSMALPQRIVTGGIERVVQHRLDRITPAGQPLLRQAAIAGRLLDLAVLAAVHPAYDLEQWLTECADAAVLEMRDGRWRFSHEKLREGVVARLVEAQRRVLHRQTAAGIEQVYAANLPPHYADLVYHYRQAGDLKREYTYARLAGQQAAAQYANEAALAYYRRALDIAAANLPSAGKDRLELLEAMGDAYLLTSQFTEAIDHFRRAIEQAICPNCHRADILRKIAKAYEQQGQYDEALQYLEQGQRLLAADEQDSQSQEMARIQNLLGWVWLRRGEGDKAIEACRQGLAIVAGLERTPTVLRDEAELHNTIGTIHVDFAGNYSEAAKAYTRSTELSKHEDNLPDLARSYNNLARTAWAQGDLEVARVNLQHMLAITQQIGNPYALGLCYNNLGVISYTMGYIKEALNYYQNALQLRKQIGDSYGVAQTRSNMGEAYLSLSQYEAAHDHLEQAATIFEEMKSEGELPEVYRLLAEVELAQANLPAAGDHAKRAREIARQIGNLEAQGVAERVWARVQVRLGDLIASRQALELSLHLLGESGNQIELARTYYDFGLWWAEQGEGREAALAHLRRAASLFAATGAEKESNQVNLILSQRFQD